jgi:4-oxalocrotonate tautomerase family enzyme
MPYVNIKITSGATRDQKTQIVSDVTDSLVRVLGKQPEHIHIVIDELGIRWNAYRRLEEGAGSMTSSRPTRIEEF